MSSNPSAIPTLAIGDLRVPALSLGAMYFGTQVPTQTAHACLDTAYDLGARFWDTANNYAFWAGGVGDESESCIGDWLRSRGSRVRDEVTIATKLGGRPKRTGGDPGDRMGLSRNAIREQIAGSLGRLRTDHVDVLYAHVDDPEVPFEETLGALSELVSEGVVGEIAASNLTAGRLREAMSTPAKHRYVALQQRFSYLVPAPGTDVTPHVLMDEDVVQVCTQLGVTRLGYSPLLSGAYTREDRPLPDGYAGQDAAMTTLRQVGERHGLDAGQAVLAWMVGRSDRVAPVVGVSRPEQVTSAWQAITTTLDAGELAELEQARLAS